MARSSPIAAGWFRWVGRSLAIACDIHPVQNLKVLNRLRALGHDEAAVQLGIEYATEQCEGLLEFGVPGIHFYVLNKSEATRRVLDRAPQLKLIAQGTSGTDNIDDAAARERGITILELSRSKLEYRRLASMLEGDPEALLFVSFTGDDQDDSVSKTMGANEYATGRRLRKPGGIKEFVHTNTAGGNFERLTTTSTASTIVGDDADASAGFDVAHDSADEARGVGEARSNASVPTARDHGIMQANPGADAFVKSWKRTLFESLTPFPPPSFVELVWLPAPANGTSRRHTTSTGWLRPPGSPTGARR